jgi:predicted O-linked N-acetylglucosamine transferase (SPINDLY family)
MRAAPVQVSFLGYPGTMGAAYFDYLIADATLIGESDRQHYAEKIAYLPHSYQVNDTRRIIPDGELRREQLWLLQDNGWAEANLRKEAQRRGVSANRLIFAPRMPLPEHLARHRAADLFLDTLPCNAHTTASDALWAGVPVLTCRGDTFAGRVAASLLHAIGLPELVAPTPAAYEALASELALHPDKLGEIRRRLADNRLTQPLFDIELYAKHLSGRIRRCTTDFADLRPEHIHVQA